MTPQEIQQIRRNGDYIKAKQLAKIELANNPSSFQFKSVLAWCYYDEIKAMVARLDENQNDHHLIQQLITVYEEYISGDPKRPDMAFSLILKIIAKQSAQINNFLSYIEWMGMNALKDEDWHSTEFQGKTFPPIAHDVARGMCKWVKSHDNATFYQGQLALDWSRTVRANMNHEDAVWLDWDVAAVLRKLGDYQKAAEVLSNVLKLKQNEFWVWREAARIYAHEDEDLALACYCKAMLCRSQPNFLVSTHEEFAAFLAGLEMYDRASYEINKALDIRNTNSWKIKEDLQVLCANEWYDPEQNNHQQAQKFYNDHSSDALTLCFENIETVPATYLGYIEIKREGKKPKRMLKLSIKNGTSHESTLASGFTNLQLSEGDSVMVTKGTQSKGAKDLIINITKAQNNNKWQHTDKIPALVSYISEDKEVVKVFANRDLQIRLPRHLEHLSLSLGVQANCYTAIHPIKNKIEVFHLDKTSSNQAVPDSKSLSGKLRKNEKGFGFIDDIFIAPHLIKDIDNGTELNIIALYEKPPKREEYSWRALSVELE